KAAERSDLTKTAKLKLVRGRPKSSASDSVSNGDSPNGMNEDKGETSGNEDVLTMLGSGNRNSRGRRQRLSTLDSDESGTDSNTENSDSNNDSDSDGSGTGDSDDDGSEGDAGESDGSSSSDDNGFIVSDSDDEPRGSKKRKLGRSAKNTSSRKMTAQLQQSVRLKGAKQRIAERLKIKF
ncbi:hypothetical protein LPJ73_006836, partial [Coemansia sp. RSA 2703]